MYPFLKIYQSNLPSISHGLPSFLGSKTPLLTNFKSSAAMSTLNQTNITNSLKHLYNRRFEKPGAEGEARYAPDVMELVAPERNTLTISFKDIENYNKNLANTIIDEYYRFMICHVIVGFK